MPAHYFKNLLALLKIEREADLQSYRKLSQSTSVTDRRAAGLSWYPIAIRNSEMSRGDYLTVETERTTHQDTAHQLRFGASAVLFSNHDAQNNRLEGTITYQVGNRCKISLKVDELPDWANEGKLGIELLFDDKSYSEMQNALKEAVKLVEDQKDGQLVRILSRAKSSPSPQDTRKQWTGAQTRKRKSNARKLTHPLRQSSEVAAA